MNEAQIAEAFNAKLRTCSFYLVDHNAVDQPSPPLSRIKRYALAGPVAYGEQMTAKRYGIAASIVAVDGDKPFMWWKLGDMPEGVSTRVAENVVLGAA